MDEPLSCLSGRSVEGDALFGIVRLNDKVRATVVNLAAGQAHLADVGKVSLPPDSMRYVAHVQTGAPYTEPDTLLLYDLLEGTTLEVAKGELNSYYLDISGDIVVWAETRGSGRNIYGYNLSQNQRFTITEGHSSRTSPQTSGDWVVYVFWHHEEQPTHILRAC
ncbi:MAG: hypothetical protein GY845_17230 [Planctomycetes bacterium]|nr:hypothetical protein [Planctomycetota bacterium]